MKRIDPAQISRVCRLSLEMGLLEENDTLVIFVDLSVLDDRLQRLRDCFPPDSLHAIPIKTNPLGFVLGHVIASGMGLEAASMGEIMLALSAGVDPSRLVFDSPAKTRAEIRQLGSICPGMRVNADSLEELKRYPSKNSGFRLGLRINPLVDPQSIKSMNVGSAHSKFGVPITSLDDIVRTCCEWQDLDGLHIHIGSQVPSIEQMVVAVSRVNELAKKINSAAGGRKITCIDIGGGFPVNYHASQPFLLEDYALALREQCGYLFDGTFQLITEFGRYVHANSTWALSTIEYVKPNSEGLTLISHAGADMFLRECYNPDDWYHQISILNSSGILKEEPTVSTSVAGPLCFGGDFITRDRTLARAQEGDFLAIQDVGASTFALWSRHCSRPFPKVIAYSSEESIANLYVAKTRESYENLITFWS